jgi:hypothetical protein
MQKDYKRGEFNMAEKIRRPVLTIHIETCHKSDLELAAKKLGMPTTMYCRMILIQSIHETKN